MSGSTADGNSGDTASIAVTPASPSIAKGLTQQFTATGTYTDNSTANLTTSVAPQERRRRRRPLQPADWRPGVAGGTSNITASVERVTDGGC